MYSTFPAISGDGDRDDDRDDDLLIEKENVTPWNILHARPFLFSGQFQTGNVLTDVLKFQQRKSDNF